MTVAVLDIGSNSIKILVATRRADGRLESLAMHTLDARISAGISKAHPRLGEEGMARGLAAIEDLLARAAPFSPDQTILVATSAVRDAENGTEFRERVRASTGHAIRVLTGDEEAFLIGRGLTCDPALADLRDFYVFDLGGGSLECLAFRHRDVAVEASLPLGCVRLTERFVADPSLPLAPAERDAIAAHTRTVLASGAFPFSLPPGAAAVCAGGSMTTVRAMLGAAEGRRVNETDPRIAIAQIAALLDRVAALPLAERRLLPGLPAARADVFPAALVTLLTVAETGGFEAFQHSFYNLRWGLADAALK
jgi:exopolyphosphatase/guanosine-5'-triphosphate,3'-diphosphate pyrophosphatase